MPNHYVPCFSDVGPSWRERWNVIREFVRRWYGESVGELGRASIPEDLPESRISVLPPSFREWIRFVHELNVDGTLGFLRRTFDFSSLDRHHASCLLMESQSQGLYGVPEDRFEMDDPAVNFYRIDHGTGDTIDEGCCNETLTGFALQQVFEFLHGEGGGCCIGVPNTAAFFDEMRDAFATHCRFDTLDVFEERDILATMFKDEFAHDERHLAVEVFRPMPLEQIPECIRRHLLNGGMYRGMFEVVLDRDDLA